MKIRISKQSAGFTLMELMITVSIIAILAVIAIPSYMSSVQKSRRADAKNALLNDVQVLERCYSQYFYYQTPAASASQPACPTLQTTSPNGYYKITSVFTTTVPQGYVLTAVPATGSPQVKDTKCASFSVDNLGNQKASTSSSTDNSAYCWSGRG